MALERFHFTRANGEEFECPYLMDSISMGKMQKIQKKHKDTPEDLPRDVMTEALGKDTANKIIDDWSMRDSQAFIKGWMNDDDSIEPSLGES